MTLEPHDVYLALSMVAACVGVYGFSRWLYYGERERAIQREIEALPPLIDYTRLRPRNPGLHLATLPKQKDQELRQQAHLAAERRHLDLVVRSSSSKVH